MVERGGVWVVVVVVYLGPKIERRVLRWMKVGHVAIGFHRNVVLELWGIWMVWGKIERLIRWP